MNSPNTSRHTSKSMQSHTLQRLKQHGHFVYEGVSFGVTYWEPVNPSQRSLEGFSNQVISLEGADESEILHPAASFSLSSLPGYGGNAPLVLIHGFAQSAQSWEPVVSCLDPVRPVWAFELVGHGASDQPTAKIAYDLVFQGEALLAFLETIAQGGTPLPTTAFNPLSDTLAPSEPSLRKLTLVGYSMGGRVVLSAMAQSKRFAQVVSDVVLESVGLGSPSAEARTEAAHKDALHAAKLREEGIEAFFAYWEQLPLFASQKALPFKVRQAIRTERLANNPEALALTFECAGQHCMPSREEVYERLQTLHDLGVRLTYLVGEKDAKYRALSHEAAQAIGLSVTIVPHCGHNIHSERAAMYAV